MALRFSFGINILADFFRLEHDGTMPKEILLSVGFRSALDSRLTIISIMDDDRLLLLSAFLVGVAVVMLKRQYMSSTRLYHAQNTIPVSIYSEDGSLEETKPLHQLVREQCPGLFCYTPTSWLFNGHLQTLMVTLYQPPVKVKFRR